MDDPGVDLLAAVDAAVAPWVVACVTKTASQQHVPVTQALVEAAEGAGVDAHREVMASLRTLLATDVDEQRTNPLSILRYSVKHPTRVLAAAGVVPMVRDEFARRSFPDDVYGLAPATWSDVDPSLHEPGIMWGAWKAGTVLQRRREEGRTGAPS